MENRAPRTIHKKEVVGKSNATRVSHIRNTKPCIGRYMVLCFHAGNTRGILRGATTNAYNVNLTEKA